MNLFELFVKIGVDDQASGKISDLSSKLGSGLATAAKVGAAAITAVTAATAAMTTALVNGVSKTAEYGDNIDKMSQKMGMTAESYQEWDAVMQHCGTSIDSMQAGMKTLATAAESGSDAFEQLGLSQESIAGMSQEELFGATITALQNVESETERTYLAGQLLGRGATELGALLNTSAEDTQAMKDRVHELSGVMSLEAVKAAAAYQDSLQDMKTAFSGLSRSTTAEFMPSITAIMDGLTEIFSGEGNSGVALINHGVNDFASKLASTIPKVISTGAEIVSSLTTAITKNLPVLIDVAFETIITFANGIAESIPELISTIVDVVIQIVETLIDNVDMLIDAAIAIMIALADGIVNAIPKLIEKVPIIITKLIEAYANNAPKMIEASLKIIIALAKGLITSIPQLIKAIPQIVMAIINGFGAYMSNIAEIGKNIVTAIGDGIKSLASSALTWGKDLIDNFVSGIKSKISAVINAVSGVASTVKSFLGFSEPEKGPLSNFHTYAPDMMNLFIQGIRDNEKKLTDQIEKTFDFGERTITAGISYGSYGYGGFSRENGYGAGQVSAVQSAVRAAIHDEISKIGIYLDGNTLVGGISERMDNGLGRIYAGNERRAMA